MKIVTVEDHSLQGRYQNKDEKETTSEGKKISLIVTWDSTSSLDCLRLTTFLLCFHRKYVNVGTKLELE